MYYEVYVDILFLENLWMNGMLLLLTAWADHVRVKKLRLVVAAAAGSIGACGLAIASPLMPGTGYFAGNVGIALGMVKLAFPGCAHLGIRTVMLYLQCFVMSGILRYLEQFHRLGGVWFAGISSISFLLLAALESGMRRRKAERIQVHTVTLCMNGKMITVEGLYDTGNGLYDPVNGRPVSVLSGCMLDTLLSKAENETVVRYIPYHTISQSGMLEMYVLDWMCIETNGKKIHIDLPEVARMPQETSVYPLILHRDMLSS